MIPLDPTADSSQLQHDRACADPSRPSEIGQLRTRMDRWSHLWSPAADPSDAHSVIASRLNRWMERCFGARALGSMHGKGAQPSLASSTPIFTAFLGRRAARELSRRVLKDM